MNGCLPAISLPELKLAALEDAGCARVFTETASGAKGARPELTAADLQARVIGLKVLTQQIDTTTPGGRLVFHMFAAIAEFERELTLERTYAGLAAARAAGRRGARKPALGPAEVKRARAMLSDPTITVQEVAKQLGVPIPTLYRHLPDGRGALEADFPKG